MRAELSGGFSSQPADLAHRLHFLPSVPRNGIFLKGQHFDLGPRWYQDVGASLCLTLLITLLLRSAPIVLSAVTHKLSKACSAGGVRTVEGMKALYLGPVPQLAFLLGKMIAFAALCITFSTVLPALHIMLFFYLVLNYWIDKWYLVRICRTPPPYDASFVHATLGWVPWALLAKLILGFWGFGSLPGTSLTSTLRQIGSAVTSQTKLGGSTLAASTQYIDTLIASNWLAARARTIGSVVILIGFVVLVVMMVVDFIAKVAWKTLKETLFNVRFGSQDEDRLWPTECPKFSDVLRGDGVSSRIRILKKADPRAGQREVLAIESDVDGSCCAGCMGPVQALLWLFGIEMYRKKIKTLEEFNNLEERNTAIIGSQNMSCTHARMRTPTRRAHFVTLP